jgi:hypothetical protein
VCEQGSVGMIEFARALAFTIVARFGSYLKDFLQKIVVLRHRVEFKRNEFTARAEYPQYQI